jgi:hypothetical protein
VARSRVSPWLPYSANREAAIARVRQVGCKQRRETPLDFGALFTAWHGRPPADDEWPTPRCIGGGYEWLAPELKLVVSLVGRVGSREICRILTERLRRLTGNPNAARNLIGLNLARQRIGLLSADVVGGLTANQAGREIGCQSIVYNEIRHGRLKATRVGHHLVIPYDDWARWKGSRVFPPTGFVQLSRLKRPLGITSDKLSEWARLGYVPTAIRCNPFGTRAASTQFGTWWIDPKVIRKLVADRRAGRPMPWWNKPEPHNLKITFTLWRKRQHPDRCALCRVIWGPDGAPTTFEEYARRYHPLPFGAKRHLTRTWTDGVTVAELAREVNLSHALVHYAIRTGVLRAKRISGRYCISRTDATRWKGRRCPTGRGTHSWMQVWVACETYGFSRAEIAAAIRSGRLTSRIGTHGAQRGVRYVSRQQIRELRETEGFPPTEAARRLGISVFRLRSLARHADWRDSNRYTIDVINTIRKRMESEAGYTIAAAARVLRKSVRWVETEIANGTARVLRTPFKKNRRYLSRPMFARLQAAAARPPRRARRLSSEWLLVSDAALLAGVSATQIQRWADLGEVRCQFTTHLFRRYHRRSVMGRARRYWTKECRFKRATPPAWLREETAA